MKSSRPQSSSTAVAFAFTVEAADAGAGDAEFFTGASNVKPQSSSGCAAGGWGDARELLKPVVLPNASRPAHADAGGCEAEVLCCFSCCCFCFSTSAARSAMVIRETSDVPAMVPPNRSLNASPPLLVAFWTGLIPPLVELMTGAFGADSAACAGVIERDEELLEDASIENTSFCGFRCWACGVCRAPSVRGGCGCEGWIGAEEFHRSAKESDIVKTKNTATSEVRGEVKAVQRHDSVRFTDRSL